MLCLLWAHIKNIHNFKCPRTAGYEEMAPCLLPIPNLV